MNLTTPTIDLIYGYDPEGLRTQTENAVISDRSEAYGHDNRQRLTQMRRGVLSTGQDGTPMVADEDLLVHDKLAAAEQWVGLDRRGNWRDYREEHKSNASTGVIRRETREASGSNAYTSIDPEAPDIQEDPPPSLDPVTPTYDGAGNLVFDPLTRVAGQLRNLTSDNFSMGPGQEFGYDEENRVVSIHRDTTDAGGPYSGGRPSEPKLLEFVYDALGRRVETKEYVDAATGATSAEPKITRHVYVGLENIQDWTWNDSASPAGYYVKQQYLWGDSERFPEPVALLRPFNAQLPSGSPQIPANAPGWHYLHDVLGSVIGLVDDTGHLVERYTYDPYGKVFIETWNASANENQGAWEPTFETNSGLPYSPLGNPWMWTGQRYDAAVGLYAFWARTYSPTLGRWLQRDPLEYVDGVNLYQYILGSPFSGVDALGLFLDPNGSPPWYTKKDYQDAVKQIEALLQDELGKHLSDQDRHNLADAVTREMSGFEGLDLKNQKKTIEEAEKKCKDPKRNDKKKLKDKLDKENAEKKMKNIRKDIEKRLRNNAKDKKKFPDLDKLIKSYDKAQDEKRKEDEKKKNPPSSQET